MLRPVGEPRRIDRAIRRLQGALKGIPARGVRLTWRGGELRTTIHWARDDSFWWAFEPRTARQALLLGHAPNAPTKRESITCEINLPRIADRKVAGIIAVDDAGALYLAHSGRMGGTRLGQRKAGFREFLADGVWRRLTWPDGAHIALWVMPNIEFFSLMEKVPAGSGGPGTPPPDIPTWSARDYGNRVGVFRLMQVLSRHGIRGTVALNSELCAYHPEIIEEGRKLGWEWVGHCESNTRRLNEAPPGEEKGIIQRTLATIAATSSTR